MQTIKADVGRKPSGKCRNEAGDLLAIATLLNRIPERFGGTGGRLNLQIVGGICPEELFIAILRFQEINITAIKANGVVEPSDITLHFLNRLADRSFPIQPVNNFAIDSFVEDLYEDTLVEAYREQPLARTPEYQTMVAKSI